MTKDREFAYRVSISYESGDRLTRDAGNMDYGKGRKNSKSKSEGAFCNISIGFDDIKEFQDKAKICDTQEFIDTVDIIRQTAKSVVNFSIGGIDVEVAMPPPYYDETGPPPTDPDSIPDFDNVGDYLQSVGFGVSKNNKFDESYFRTIYKDAAQKQKWGYLNVTLDKGEWKMSRWCKDTEQAEKYNPMTFPEEFRKIIEAVDNIANKQKFPGGGQTAF